MCSELKIHQGNIKFQLLTTNLNVIVYEGVVRLGRVGHGVNREQGEKNRSNNGAAHITTVPIYHNGARCLRGGEDRIAKADRRYIDRDDSAARQRDVVDARQQGAILAGGGWFRGHG